MLPLLLKRQNIRPKKHKKAEKTEKAVYNE